MSPREKRVPQSPRDREGGIKEMIYLDNAATTWPKPLCVRQAMVESMEQFGANPGRGGHSMSLAASEAVYRCRETAARMFHLDNPAGVVFTMNCTMSLNIVLKGLLKNGGHVVVSSLEHNAVMRPLTALSVRRPVYTAAKVVPGDDDQTVNNFRRCLTPYTKAIVCLHASNVFGFRLPIRRLGQLAREYGLLFVVDAAQTAGVLPIDMQQDNIDYLCVPGHKGLYGPMGTGMLLCAPEKPLPTLMEGGTGSQSLLLTQPEELPDRMESGTVNLPGICGLRAGMEWVMEHGVEAIGREETWHLSMLYEHLSRMPKVRLYAPRPSLDRSAPVLSFNLDGKKSEETAALLSEAGVAVRAGIQCAPSAHRQMHTLPDGTVRMAPSLFTTDEEIEKTCKILWEFQ